MKHFILFTAFLLGFNIITSAQFYNKTLLFIEVGKTIESSESVIYVHFDNDGEMHSERMSKSTARSKYNDDVLDEYAVNIRHEAKYCPNTSTNKYEVYKEGRYETKYVPFGPFNMTPGGSWEKYSIGGYWFNAFSSDFGEMITWFTTRESNEPKSKTYYKRINPKDLVPKEVDYDFLY